MLWNVGDIISILGLTEATQTDALVFSAGIGLDQLDKWLTYSLGG